MSVITRFAPSPTGMLHIGGARTALFNFLFSRSRGGKFLLRIEDTDRARSTQDAIQAILNGLKWLDLRWDDEVVMQFSRSSRHSEVAQLLLEKGLAYRCYLTQEEIIAMRASNPHAKIESPWRDHSKKPAKGVKPTIRLKIDKEGATTIADKVRGEVTVSNAELDDMILLRSDGTPTYMLAVVVDDYDMNITHVIRGDDHFTNSFRQCQIIGALSWPKPEYAHIPLIHGQDGAKLSKRHGAMGINGYVELGYLPEAICNYLLRLGWSCGDLEIISKEEAINLFSLDGLNKSPARFDWDKLNSLNAHYIAKKSDIALTDLLHLENEIVKGRVQNAMPLLKTRVKTLNELKELSYLYKAKLSPPDERAAVILRELAIPLIDEVDKVLSSIEEWQTDQIKVGISNLGKSKDVSEGKMMQIMRALVTASFKGPSIYETMAILGKEEVLKRIKAI